MAAPAAAQPAYANITGRWFWAGKGNAFASCPAHCGGQLGTAKALKPLTCHTVVQVQLDVGQQRQRRSQPIQPCLAQLAARHLQPPQQAAVQGSGDGVGGQGLEVQRGGAWGRGASHRGARSVPSLWLPVQAASLQNAACK